MSGRVAGKRAVVIGAGSVGPGWGNGKAAAVLYAREGARVLAVDRDARAAEQTRMLIADEGGTAEVFVGDMTDARAASGAIAHAVELWDGIDIVHFNIGISRPGGPVETSLEDWDEVFRVNLDAAFFVTRAALPVMEADGGGAIVYISSLAAIRAGGYSFVSYEASKAALGRLARSVAAQYAGRGIRANVILPGLIDTPHVQHYVAGKVTDAAGLAARRAAAPPMKRQGSAWEVAQAALFLASDDSSYITGVELPVDGGLSLLAPIG